MKELPFSQACENNKQPILEVLQGLVLPGHKVIEIGSGTGQHAVFFASSLDSVMWQCTDQVQYHEGLLARLGQANLDNILPPIELEAVSFSWETLSGDAIFTANTAHIMPWNAVQATIAGAATVLHAGSLLLWYGPFNRDGEFTSETNQRFNDYLKQQDSSMGIRDDQEMIAETRRHGFELASDIQMPANNRFLIFRRT